MRSQPVPSQRPVVLGSSVHYRLSPGLVPSLSLSTAELGSCPHLPFSLLPQLEFSAQPRAAPNHILSYPPLWSWDLPSRGMGSRHTWAKFSCLSRDSMALPPSCPTLGRRAVEARAAHGGQIQLPGGAQLLFQPRQLRKRQTVTCICETRSHPLYPEGGIPDHGHRTSLTLQSVPVPQDKPDPITSSPSPPLGAFWLLVYPLTCRAALAFR